MYKLQTYLKVRPSLFLHVLAHMCHLQGVHTPNLKLTGIEQITSILLIKSSIQQLNSTFRVAPCSSNPMRLLTQLVCMLSRMYQQAYITVFLQYSIITYLCEYLTYTCDIISLSFKGKTMVLNLSTCVHLIPHDGRMLEHCGFSVSKYVSSSVRCWYFL
jgi:hypothetical protein